MSGAPDPQVDLDAGVRSLIARASTRALGVERRLALIAQDLAADPLDRLDDRTRAGIVALLHDLVGIVRGQIVRHAVRLLTDGGHEPLAARIAEDNGDLAERLIADGLFGDGNFLRELDARVRERLLADALAPVSAGDADRPSLLARLTDDADPLIAEPAMAVLLAGSRRAVAAGGSALARTDLAAEAQHHLAWWVAAALRRRAGALSVGDAARLDEALVAATERSLAAHDEGVRLEAAAMRLAAALDPAPGELGDLLVEALGDRQVMLLAALIAHATLGDVHMVLEAVLDPDASRLWIMLRAIDLDQRSLARIGLLLCEADPRRDVEAFAGAIDSIMALAPDLARDLLVGDRLPGAYRTALRLLGVGA